MGNEAAITMVGDWDLKAPDIRQYYAGYARRALPEGALWRLSLATSCLPDHHPGFMAWITLVSGTDRFGEKLADWAVGLGETIARMKPKLKLRRRTFVASYDPAWGKQAALDGLIVALFGEAQATPINERAKQYGCDWHAYARLRAFVAGAILLSTSQFEDALVWTHKVARDA